jgi:hypothetical protein
MNGGKIYLRGYAIEEPDGRLMGTGIPKIWRDPQYAPRWIQMMARQRDTEPENVGRVVEVAIVVVAPK